MEPFVRLRVLQEKACVLAAIKRHYAMEAKESGEAAATQDKAGEKKKVKVTIDGLTKLSEMLTEAVGQPGSQQCQMSLGLSATPLHDFSQSMVLLQNRPNKWPNEPRVGPQVAEMFKELHSFHDSRLVYPEGKSSFFNTSWLLTSIQF